MLLADCCSNGPRTAAIVGAAFSGVTMAAASLAGLFHVPMVSYASSSRLLSDRSRFRDFFRTVPSDELQAEAVTDLLRFLRWHLIITLASDNEYGRSGITALKQKIQSQKVRKTCIVVDELFSRKGSKEDIQNIFNKIKRFPNARTIVLYAEFPDAKYFFDEARNASLRDYMFVASDSWAGSTHVTKGSEEVFRHIVGLRPPVANIPQFDFHFIENLRRNNRNSPWRTEFRERMFCQQNKSDKCYSEVHDNGYIPYVVDAVFAIAHALHAMLNCSTRACPDKLNEVKLRGLSQFIQNVSFPGFSQRHVYFDKNGCAGGQYDIYHIQRGSDKYVKVGDWKDYLSPKLNLTLFPLGEVSKSICSRDCKKGMVVLMDVFSSERRFYLTTAC